MSELVAFRHDEVARNQWLNELAKFAAIYEKRSDPSQRLFVTRVRLTEGYRQLIEQYYQHTDLSFVSAVPQKVVISKYFNALAIVFHGGADALIYEGDYVSFGADDLKIFHHRNATYLNDAYHVVSEPKVNMNNFKKAAEILQNAGTVLTNNDIVETYKKDIHAKVEAGELTSDEGDTILHAVENDSTDMVNHPPHYTSHPSGIEAIEITRHMSFNLGSAMKYIWRCDLKKDAIEDLEKAVWYLQDEIEKRKKE